MDYNFLSFSLRSKDKLEKMVDNARKKGVSEEKIKLLVKKGVDEMCKKVKEDYKF